MNSELVIIIPAFNEEITIASVISDFRENFPDSTIVVIDNASTDNTKKIINEEFRKNTKRNIYLFESRKGKGSAIRFAIRIIEADIYVLVDADSTYHASDLHAMLDIFNSEKADIVVGDRMSLGDYSKENKRLFHEFGNKLVQYIINKQYNSNLKDIMSGYRVMSKNFIKTYAMLYDGFELETDISIHCLDKKLRLIEYPIKYSDRPIGSYSKLSTVKDGIRVLLTIFNLIRFYKPLLFFGTLSLLTFITSLVTGSIPIYDYINYGIVYHIPLSIVASSSMILTFIFLITGLILDSISRSQRINFEYIWNTK